MQKLFKKITVIFTLITLLISTSGINLHKISASNEVEISNNDKFINEREFDFSQIAYYFNLSSSQKNELLNLYLDCQNPFQFRSRTTVIKAIVAALKTESKWVGAKIAAKTISDFTDYLLGWQASLEEGITNFFV